MRRSSSPACSCRRVRRAGRPRRPSPTARCGPRRGSTRPTASGCTPTSCGPKGADRGDEDAGHPRSSARTSASRGRRRARPDDRFYDFFEGAERLRARLLRRHGRPARDRRQLRLPRHPRPRRADRRAHGGRVGGRRSRGRPARSACTARATTPTPASSAPRCGRRASPRSSPSRSSPDRYRGSYNDRVRFLQSLAYPRRPTASRARQGWSRRQTTREYIANSRHPQRRLPGAAWPSHYGDDPSERRSGRRRDFVERWPRAARCRPS